MSPEHNPYAPPLGGRDDGPRDGPDEHARSPSGALKRRDVEGLAMLFGAAVLQSLAYHAAQTLLSFPSYALIRAPSAQTAGVLRWTVQVGTIIGGVAALRLGPRATAAVGAALAAAGQVAFMLTAPPLLAVVVLGLGVGMAGPCFVAAAAETLEGDLGVAPAPSPHRATVVATCATLAACVVVLNAAELLEMGLAPVVIGAFIDRFDAGLLHLILCAVTVLALGLVVASARRAHHRTEGAARASDARRAGGLVGIAILTVPYAVYTFGQAAWPLPSEVVSIPGGREALVAATLLGIAISTGGFAALVIAARRRGAWPPIMLYGAGLLVVAPGLLAMASGASLAVHGVAVALGVIGYVAVGSVPTAYAAIAVRGRARTLVVAVWSVARMLVAGAGLAVHDAKSGGDALLWSSVLLCVGGGVKLLHDGRRWHQKYFEAPVPQVLRRRSKERDRAPAPR